MKLSETEEAILAEFVGYYWSLFAVSPSEVNKFPPAPEILNHVYWPKYS